MNVPAIRRHIPPWLIRALRVETDWRIGRGPGSATSNGLVGTTKPQGLELPLHAEDPIRAVFLHLAEVALLAFLYSERRRVV